MKARLLSAIIFSFTLTIAVCAQDANSAAPTQQDNGGGGYGRGGYSRGGFGGGRGLMGTVTEVAADHYLVKTEDGQIYTVHFSANTRILKQTASQRRPGGMGRDGGIGMGAGGGMGRGGNPPEQIKAADIKVGDVVGAMGEMDTAAKSIGAVVVVQVDPERAKEMAEMRANYGKTWLQGKVTAIDGVKVTLMGSIDNASHDLVVDENTTFRKRRDPITLADIQIGDMVRTEGSLKGGTFTATVFNVIGMPPDGPPSVPRNGQPQ